jgi:DNA polymerase I-like protein with 3'-5' exonuclease and polymerase domains
MPYKIKKINGGYKVCKTTGKCFSKKPLSKKKAVAQRAAIAINRELKKRNIDGWVCAQIHDQIVTEIPETHAEECAKIVQECMENTTKISIALKAPAAIGKNWKDAH